ncbi:MAG: hypothetical protein JXA15_06995 [Spirochaetales bacterium]|nr:hypothetical protein [Spirochaetales bacterium]
MSLTQGEHAKTLLEVATKRAALFLAGLDFALVFLYVAGNAQGFLDETQSNLVDWAGWVSWGLVPVALLAGFARAYMPTRRGEAPAWWAAAAWLALGALAAVFGFLASLLSVLVAGFD